MTFFRSLSTEDNTKILKAVRLFTEWVGYSLAILLSMSLVVSVGVAFKRLMDNPYDLSIGMGVYLSAAAAILWCNVKFINKYSVKTFLILVCIVSFAIKLSLVILSKSYQQANDYSLMYKYTSILYQQGINSPLLKQFYDSDVFFDRVILLFLPVKILFGEGDIIAVQILNCMLATGSLLLTYYICSNVFDETTGRWASLTFLLFPIHSLDVLNYTHDIPGLFLFLLGVSLGLRLITTQNRYFLVFMSIALGLILFVVKLQRGTHQMLLLFLVLIAILTILTRFKENDNAHIFIWLVILPVFIFGLLSLKYSEFKSTHEIRANYSRYSFLARGWSVQSKGEYDGTFEQIDSAAPTQVKNHTQLSLIASQFFYNQIEAFTLPLVKATKFFLLGYASTPENSLKKNNAFLSDIAIASRLLFTMIVLTLMVKGCLLISRKREITPPQFFILIFPLLCVTAVAFFGETSPRYSYVTHFALASFCGVAMSDKSKSFYLIPDNILFRRSIIFCGFTLLGYVGAMVVLFLIVRLYGRQYQFVDMRNATYTPATLITPKVLAPFEQYLGLPASTEFEKINSIAGTLELPIKASSKAFLYVISSLPDKISSDNLSCNIDVGGRRYASIPFSKLKKMTYVGFDVPQESHPNIVRISVERTGEVVERSPVTSETPVLKWGYIGFIE